jgi:hypothetical protein
MMQAAARRRLTEDLTLTGGLVTPSARGIRAAAAAGWLLGGPVSLAVAYATAVMEVSNAMGVVVAAPTAGSCGVLPGVLMAAAERLGATGLIIVRKATFSAEVARGPGGAGRGQHPAGRRGGFRGPAELAGHDLRPGGRAGAGALLWQERHGADNASAAADMALGGCATILAAERLKGQFQN